MDEQMMLELFGYIGSALVVVSMLMSSIVKLRIINGVGSVISAIYALIVGALPLALMNFCLIAINGYNLVKVFKTKKCYDYVAGETDGALVRYFLERYNDDIKQYFPGYSIDRIEGNSVYVACFEGTPAGVIVGKNNNGNLDILIDYSTPTYRDCSVAKFLYSKLAEDGIRSLSFAEQVTDAHASYLAKMGYEKTDGIYVKNFR